MNRYERNEEPEKRDKPLSVPVETEDDDGEPSPCLDEFQYIDWLMTR